MRHLHVWGRKHPRQSYRRPIDCVGRFPNAVRVPWSGACDITNRVPTPTRAGAGVCGTLEDMRIVVCVKHVPDTQSDRRIEDGHIVRGEDDVLNELDENAIEAAVQLVEAEDEGEVIALTMGPEDAEDAILRALQMGADRGVLVTDERLAGSDAVGTSQVLGAAIRRIGQDTPVDLVVTGMASLDGMTSMMPAALAAQLHLPFLGLAHAMEVAPEGSGHRVRIERSADGFDDTLSAPTPVVVSVTDQITEPRYPSFKTMKAARSKPVETWELEDLRDHGIGEDPDRPLSATQVLDAEARRRDTAGVLVTDSGDGGERLARYLIDEVL